MCILYKAVDDSRMIFIEDAAFCCMILQKAPLYRIIFCIGGFTFMPYYAYMSIIPLLYQAFMSSASSA